MKPPPALVVQLDRTPDYGSGDLWVQIPPGALMATKKQGVLTVKTEWWKHLRPFQKRVFWSRHRAAEKREIRRDA